MNVNIVSRDPRFYRLVALELERFGLGITITESPAEDHMLCLVDVECCHALPPSAGTVLILFGENAPEQLIRRAKERLPKPIPLPELRRVIVEQLSAREPSAKKAILKRPSYRGREARLVIDHEKHAVTVGNSEPIFLSETEYKLLCRLKEFGNRPLSAKDVTDILGNSGSNKFNVYICYLRRKLERGSLRLIHTVRGQGYTLKSQERKQP